MNTFNNPRDQVMLNRSVVKGYLGIVLALSVAGCGSLTAEKEPVHEGKPATYWIRLLGASYAPNEIYGRPSAEQPRAALKALGPTAVPALIKALKHKDQHVRAAAAIVLSGLGPEAAVTAAPALVEASSVWHARNEALNALKQMGPAAKAVAPDILERLQGGEVDLRFSLALTLAKIDPDNPAAVNTLIGILKVEDTDAEQNMVQRRKNKAGWATAAAEALRELGPSAKAAVPTLIAALKDVDDDLPSAAAYALGRLGGDAKAAIPALTEAVQTKTNNQRLRAAAALALWLIEPESQEAHPVLLDVLREPGTNETLIATVRRNLASSGPEAFPRLFVLGQALDSNIQAPALQSLEGMGAESEGPLLSPQAP